MKKSLHPMVEVRHSPVHGHGVFALRRIRKGTTIMEYLGDRVSHDEADARYEHKAPDDNHTFLFTVDSRTVIDGGVDGNDARFINHGCDPNCESTSQSRRIFVEAIRTIQPGEELTYDYQIQRDPDDPPNVDEIFACRCGAAKCRGSMLVARKKPRASRPGAKPTTRAGATGTRHVAKRESAKRAGGKRSRHLAKRESATRAGGERSRHLAKRESATRAGGRDRPQRDGARRDIAKRAAAGRAARKQRTAKRGGRPVRPR